MRALLAMVVSTALAHGAPAAETVSLAFDAGIPQEVFAAQEIRSALAGTGHPISAQDGAWQIVFLPIEAGIGTESYRVRVAGRRIEIAGGDASGAMYGGLEVAEAIRTGGGPQGVSATEGAPHIIKRGIKFNIPLDARTPSYSDGGDSAQRNIPEVWSMVFWREMLDEMARHRYNTMTIWNLHPFPSLVKVPEFPEVALDDVLRTTVRFDTSYNLRARDLVRPEHAEHMEVVKKLTIDQKIAFWREVMQYAKDRGIEFYVFTWNIYTFGAGGKHGILQAQDNPTTIAYFRASVREMIRTYPLLAGIGITAGEWMDERPDGFDKEKWLWKAYGEGLRDGLKDQPERDFRLIHRYHETELEPMLAEWKDTPCRFDLSYKYAIAHMYSHPAPPFASKALADLPPHLRMWMTVRNDDMHHFRWGDPDYAREFIKALPGRDKMIGYYLGADGYTWGREFISTEPEEPRQLVMQKMWYSFLLWGRLSYDPSLSNERFQRILAARFPGVDAAKLYSVLATAGKIIPQVSRFFWRNIDLEWYPEACTSHPYYHGFHTVTHFMKGMPMPNAGVLNIGRYVRRTLRGEAIAEQTPPQVVEALKGHAQAVLSLIEELGGLEGTLPEGDRSGTPAMRKELRLTLGDQRAMALLGLYYAEKIAGATELGFFDATGDTERQAAAVRHLELALEHWRAYAATASQQYRPQLLSRVGYIDFNALTDKVAEDIEIARTWQRKQ